MKNLICPKCHEKIELTNEVVAELLKDTDNQKIQDEIQKRVELRTKEIEAKYVAEAKLKLIKDSEEKQKQIALLETQIKVLETKIENHEKDTKLAVSDAVASLKDQLSKKEQEVIKLTDDVSDVKKEAEIQQNYLKKEFNEEIERKEKEIVKLKEYRYGDSTKDLGESLEKYCENLFEEMRADAYPHAYFEKDNQVVDGGKADYLFKDFSSDGVELCSIIFDMKTEKDSTATKHKNTDFLEKLNKDRVNKGYQFAVLVSTLEAESDLYNRGIVDVSHKYPDMFVVRPQFFMAIIGLIRNLALKSLGEKRELVTYKKENADLTAFEQSLMAFKKDAGANYERAKTNFDKAIEDIDKSIKALEDTKAKLLSTTNQLRIGTEKVEEITIRKLTKNNDGMAQKFINAGININKKQQ